MEKYISLILVLAVPICIWRFIVTKQISMVFGALAAAVVPFTVFLPNNTAIKVAGVIQLVFIIIFLFFTFKPKTITKKGQELTKEQKQGE